MLTSRSSLPTGASSRQVTSSERGLGLLGAHGVVGAQQVLEEVLVALARRAQQVRPPDREHPRPVLRRVRVLDRELQIAGQQLLLDVLGGLHARRPRLLDDLERVAVETGKDGIQPERADWASVSIIDAALEAPLAQRGGQQVGAEVVVAPLVGVDVPERRPDHLPGGPLPVEGEGQVRPAGHRPALLLADVVRPAAAVDALAAGQRDHRQERAVDRVGVEPVVGARTEDDHRAAAGVLRVLRELPADALGLAAGTPVISSCQAGV